MNMHMLLSFFCWLIAHLVGYILPPLILIEHAYAMMSHQMLVFIK